VSCWRRQVFSRSLGSSGVLFDGFFGVLGPSCVSMQKFAAHDSNGFSLGFGALNRQCGNRKSFGKPSFFNLPQILFEECTSGHKRKEREKLRRQ